MHEHAEEALRLSDLPIDVSLGQAHVRVRNLPDAIDIRGIRVHGNHIGKLVIFQGIIRKATDVRPKITEAGFKCQHYEKMTHIPQTGGEFQEPRKCQGCERQGSFRVSFDQSEFIDSQKLRIQGSPEGLHGGDTPSQSTPTSWTTSLGGHAQQSRGCHRRAPHRAADAGQPEEFGVRPVYGRCRCRDRR